MTKRRVRARDTRVADCECEGRTAGHDQTLQRIMQLRLGASLLARLIVCHRGAPQVWS